MQPLHECLSGEGASNKSKCVTLMEDMLGGFKMLKKTCPEAPVSKSFLLETDASKQGLGAVLSQKQTDGQYHLVSYTNQSLAVHEYNYHSTKEEFLALKWVIMEQF